ncbi:MAG: ATP-binding cassette domain-containing protein, partial [Anaerolineales bacterium]|nr:ATP-binding cassette domain-containing protein [Anaerolineales bacterium]
MKVQDADLGLINLAGLTSLALGRLPDGNDRVLGHPAVSARHACLELRPDGQWWVVDLNSDHGTFVNQQRAGPEGLPVRLEQDTLWIAPFALRLSTRAENTAPKPAHLRLDLVNLSRRAGSRILLDLQGVPLSFRPGEFIAVVGGSGAGKSTLLKALLGVDTLGGRGRDGSIYFNNQLLIQGPVVRGFEPLNTVIGYVPQQDDSMPFQLTAREALSFAARLRFASDLPSQERAERVQQALAAVKLEREELQKKPISQLSGGQRKRVNVAMELVAEPRLLFLDEPTSGLDPGLDLEMMRLLKEWAAGSEDHDPKTIVLITHATENVRLCDYIVFMGRTLVEGQEHGGCVLYFGPPDGPAREFFGTQTFSEVYQLVDSAETASRLRQQLVSAPAWSQVVWDRARTTSDIRESEALEADAGVAASTRPRVDGRKLRRQFGILVERYALLLSRDRGAFVFQLLQGVLVALLLWGVAGQDVFTVGGVRAAPKTLFILSIAATWLGLLNATKEIVKERRIYGRERRYGIHPIPYVLSKVGVLGTLGLWQMASLVFLVALRLPPESPVGTLARGLPAGLQLLMPLGVEWFISLELMLLAGVALGLCLSAFSRSIDQATMLMFPAMLIQVLLAGLLFDVGPFAWLAFTHWGLQALGNSLDLEAMFAAAGKASDPILDTLNFAGSGVTLLGAWLALLGMTAGLIALTCWRQ